MHATVRSLTFVVNTDVGGGRGGEEEDEERPWLVVGGEVTDRDRDGRGRAWRDGRSEPRVLLGDAPQQHSHFMVKCIKKAWDVRYKYLQWREQTVKRLSKKILVQYYK